MKQFAQTTAALAILALFVLGIALIFKGIDSGALVGVISAISGLGGYVLGFTRQS
jgi:hypothetical protein